MSGDSQALLARHAPRGLLIDTNLLLLLTVGLLDRGLVPRFHRTRGYTAEDFDLLARFAGLFTRLVVTPQVLAEISNLAASIKEPRLSEYYLHLSPLLQNAREDHVPKDRLLAEEWGGLLPKLGFTDVSIIEAAREGGYLILTDDLKAAEYARRAGCGAVNFNHLRAESWFSP